MRKFITSVAVLAATLAVAIPTAIGSDTDPGGGGYYPYYTGDCRLTGGAFGPGDYYMYPGNQRRDKCSSNGAFMYIEFWNGSSWYQTGGYYD